MVKKLLNFFFTNLASQLYTPEESIKKHGGKVGRHVFWGKDVLVDFDYAFLLEIGDGAVISARTIIELHDSCIPNVMGRGLNKIGRVCIGRRSYIGVSSVILPGVSIGDGAIVGAMSLVNRDIPGEEVWAGIPVKFICTVQELDKKRKSESGDRTAYFDWIGEIEKSALEYPAYKKNFIERVRAHFDHAVS